MLTKKIRTYIQSFLNDEAKSIELTDTALEITLRNSLENMIDTVSLNNMRPMLLEKGIIRNAEATFWIGMRKGHIVLWIVR